MLSTQQQRELEKWLIKHQPQIRFALENDDIKEVLYQVYEQGIIAGLAMDPNHDPTPKDVDDDLRTDYSSLLIDKL